MLFHLHYERVMNDILQWNTLYGPLLLCFGIGLQAFFFIKLNSSFIFPCVGALCISFVAFMDKDITLFLGQLALLFLQWCLHKKEY